MYDPSQWEDKLLVEKCPIMITDIDFSKDKYSRYFFTSYYVQNCLIERNMKENDLFILHI